MDSNNDLIPAFFCVPDITGFTQFVASADINFTKEVIPTLLRRLIDCNILNLSVGEIEGDAIFFYKTGRLPAVNRVAQQCQIFYNVFSDFLESLKKNHPENYQKYLTTTQLGLKMIIHHGMISTANIKGRTKLIGQDVIITHKLLKNSITEGSYVLLTENYLAKIKNQSKLSSWFNWQELVPGKEEYEYIGEVRYNYITLGKMEEANDEDPFATRQRKIS